MDYGIKGYSDTLAELSKAGIHYFGAGTLDDNCNNPLLLDFDGVRLALLGYVCPTTHPIFSTKRTPGVMPINLDQIRSDYELAKRLGADRTIVCLHWGKEQVSLPKFEDIQTALGILDFGADIIIGHHAHCVQPYCRRKRGTVFFGLGNCIFPSLGRKVPGWNRESLMVKLNLSDFSWECSGTLFDGDNLTPKNIIIREICDSTLNNPGNYKKKYSANVRLRIFNYMISQFVNEPKIPRIRHIIGYLQAIKQP